LLVLRVMRSILLIAITCLVGCVADDIEDEVEDLGALGGKADRVMTRNLTLRPKLASGAPSKRTFTLETATRFRVSLAYAPDGPTKLVASDESGAVIAESPSTWQPTIVVPEAAAPRTLKLRVESLAGASLPVRLHVATPEARSLRIATFNIRWYGVGGNVDMPVPEHRNPALKAFVAEHMADADLIVFEEIVDATMLLAEVVPAGWACETYKNTQPNHQFVVACHPPELALTREADDDDLAYAPLAMGSLRPGLAGVLRDVRTGAPIARVMGVHLKALTDSTTKRLAQAKIIADRFAALAAANEQLPGIALGDFNAHRAVDTMREKDDWDLISDVFAATAGVGLAHVEHGFTNTYVDKDAKALILDHMWVERARATQVAVPGACNLPWATEQAAIVKYFDELSDHCPLIATIALD
jgi:hypothetical protein